MSDNTPPIVWLERNWVVSENEKVGSVIARVNARDDQNDPLEFGLEAHGGFGEMAPQNRTLPFHIDNETGIVYTNESLVGRAGENLFLYVTVWDGQLTAKSEVYVNIVSQNHTKSSPGRRPPHPGKSQFPLLPPGFPQRLPPPINQRPSSNNDQRTQLKVQTSSQPPPSSTTLPPSTTTTPVPKPSSEIISETIVTSTSKSVFKVPHSKTTELPKTIEYASDRPNSKSKPPPSHLHHPQHSLLAQPQPQQFLNPRIFKKKHLSKKDANLRKEAERHIMRDDHILMQQWHGPRAFSNRYEGWQENMFQSSNIMNDPVLNQKSDDKWEVPRQHIKVFDILGEGCFGQVWKCEALGIDGREGPCIVAVKTLKENAGERERLDLLQELTVMKTLDPHPNVVRLLGCCTEKEPFFVIMEYVPYGKLQSFLRSSRAQRYYNNMHGKSNSLTSRDLTSFCYQVARGMQFLSSRGVSACGKDGYRLEKPDHCRRELYNIMYYCWDKEPNERPNFTELCDLLEKLLLNETDYIELERFPDHSYYNMSSNIMNDPVLNQKSDDKWEVPRQHIKVFDILGEGCFGQVWKCEALGIDGREGPCIVAVKTLKENAGERERLDLLQELTVMKTLDPHPNVVRLLGCCTEKEPFFVIMEYVPYGKLQSFLRSSRAQRYYNNMHGKSNSLTSRDLTSFCYQVARGMQFLSSRGIIHRDLAARNVLIGENHCCKVADFGFARDLMTSSVYERKSEGRLPIRWMAPESLYDNIFSVKSDIWSFGVLIWEIVTLGSTPYPGMAAAEVMKKVSHGG
ncbi:tyrosine kinase receptor Cad96Ca-like [Diaphorina citri]|uniref:receptor protein-tyrosine kinase n=1 Tax=Diaphorina citri TaxID=121845 RepID=A0A3Q0J4V9_DIACI|nr:tyrosine kinase receptor Cad96Ca-like [Diaphorina citri]